MTALLIVSLPSIAFCDDQKPEAIYKAALPSVMTLKVDKTTGESVTGTGFMAIKDGVAVTAWHVVHDAKTVVAKFSDGQEFEASGLIDKDEKRDIAIIRVKVFGVKLLPVATAAPEVGSAAYVIGSPLGLEFSISSGLLSQIQVNKGVNNYQFSCPASPGNSGGPLLNANGEVTGVVSWQYKEGQNLNFAIPSTYVLGLDPTLPTQPWDTVKATVSNDVLANDNFDKLMAKCEATAHDAMIAGHYIEVEVIRANWGYKNGIPFTVYSIQYQLESQIEELKAITVKDPQRIRIQEKFLKRALDYNVVIFKYTRGVRWAQSTNGWEATSNDLVTQARGIARSIALLDNDDWKFLLNSKTFMSALPTWLIPSPRLDAFILGLATWSNDPLKIVVVTPGSEADRAGFRSGDVLLSIEATELHTVRELKEVLLANPDKKMTVTVLRDKKRKDLKIQLSKPTK